MEREPITPADFAGAVLAGLVLVGLAATELYSYLLFHSLAEAFSIVVACGTFMVVWNARRFFENSYITLIGIALLFVAALDLLHMLAFEGMGVFVGYGSDLAIQLWLCARYLHSVSFLMAGLLIHRRLNVRSVLAGYILVVLALLGSVLYWEVFPDCFVEGAGLTPFKKFSEYAICLILLASMLLLCLHRKEFDGHVLRLLLLSLVATIASELAFTLYVSVDSPANMLGHLLKIVAFYLIYKAVIETALLRPYNMLFRDLQQREEALRIGEVRFHRMVDESPDGVLVVDRAGVVRYMNPAAEGLFDRKANDLIGQAFGFPVTAGRTTQLELARKDAGTMTARMCVVKTVWDGQPSFLVTVHDITDQKHREGRNTTDQSSDEPR